VVAVQRLVLLDDADDGAGEVVVAMLVESRHLRRLAARERHVVRAAAARDALDDPRDLAHGESGARDVVHEGDRPRGVHQDVVHAVVDEILAHRIPAARLQRHHHLGADAVRAEHQVASACRPGSAPCRRRRPPVPC
jgi:hypothetical protein